MLEFHRCQQPVGLKCSSRGDERAIERRRAARPSVMTSWKERHVDRGGYGDAEGGQRRRLHCVDRRPQPGANPGCTHARHTAGERHADGRQARLEVIVFIAVATWPGRNLAKFTE